MELAVFSGTQDTLRARGVAPTGACRASPVRPCGRASLASRRIKRPVQQMARSPILPVRRARARATDAKLELNENNNNNDNDLTRKENKTT